MERDRECEVQTVDPERLFHASPSDLQRINLPTARTNRFVYSLSTIAADQVERMRSLDGEQTRHLGARVTRKRVRTRSSGEWLGIAKAVGGSILRVDGFEKFFVGGPAVDLDFELLGDAGGDLRGHRTAQGGLEGVAALQERFDEAKFVEGDAADVVGCGGILLADFEEWAGGFNCFFVHDDSTRYEIAKALVLLAEKNADDGDRVENGELVDDAKQIAGDGVVGMDGAAVVFHYAELGVALSRGLALPHRFKKSKVAIIDDEARNDHDRDGPLRAYGAKNANCGD